jgi:hypothetical protein
MRTLFGALAVAVSAAASGGALAAPAVQIDNAVARVTVIPEPRADVKVEVARASPHLPLRVWSFAGRTHVDGGLDHRVRGCSGEAAFVAGLGEVSSDAIPQVVIHVPLDAHVAASGAVWGQVGRANALDLSDAGCGAWQVANIRGQLKVSQAGSGATHAGQAGSAMLSAVGGGAITTREILGAVDVTNLGSGDIDIASVNGPLKANLAGSGHVRIAAGHASRMEASIAGSGGIILGGVADSLKASVAGSGDVRVARVTGQVRKAVIGSGVVRIGS